MHLRRHVQARRGQRPVEQGDPAAAGAPAACQRGLIPVQDVGGQRHHRRHRYPAADQHQVMSVGPVRGHGAHSRPDGHLAWHSGVLGQRGRDPAARDLADMQLDDVAVRQRGIGDAEPAPDPGPLGMLHGDMLAGLVLDGLVGLDGQHRQVIGQHPVPKHRAAPGRRASCLVGPGDHRIGDGGVSGCPGSLSPVIPCLAMPSQRAHQRHADRRVVLGRYPVLAMVRAQLPAVDGQQVRRVRQRADLEQRREQPLVLRAHHGREHAPQRRAGAEQVAVEVTRALLRAGVQRDQRALDSRDVHRRRQLGHGQGGRRGQPGSRRRPGSRLEPGHRAAWFAVRVSQELADRAVPRFCRPGSLPSPAWPRFPYRGRFLPLCRHARHLRRGLGQQLRDTAQA